MTSIKVGERVALLCDGRPTYRGHVIPADCDEGRVAGRATVEFDDGYVGVFDAENLQVTSDD